MRPVLLALFMVLLALSGLAPARAEPDAQFVGSEKCAMCHRAQYEDWRKSHHAGAMQVADDKTVLGDFKDIRFRKGDVESIFFRRDGKFYVRTDGPNGALADFEIKYTFGLYPLQQYLIELPGGRLQAFGIAWDARPADQGGQRWFDLYPDRKLAAGDPLHWTGIDQNWNYQCAWCHSTDLKKNYDPAKATFDTHWSEISVGCEACHGPASGHLAWTKGGAGLTADEKKSRGFALRLDQRAGVTWTANPEGTAIRSQPLGASQSERKEELVCAGCHSRRGQFSDAPRDALHYYDAFHPSTLAPGLYYPDGQQRDEVYNFASFAQSRMHAAGVTCSDCHNPHSGKLKLAGNEVCGQCHAAKVFDTPAHHHHPEGSPGAQCASCHMPTTTYMGVHARQDHSMRIPRPDRTLTLGTPNACNKCHADKDAKWAVAALKGWGMDDKPGAQTFAETFALADADGPGATGALVGVAKDEGQSAIARASAVNRLNGAVAPEVLEAAAQLAKADDPMIRAAAAGMAAGAAGASARGSSALALGLDWPAARTVTLMITAIILATRRRRHSSPGAAWPWAMSAISARLRSKPASLRSRPMSAAGARAGFRAGAPGDRSRPEIGAIPVDEGPDALGKGRPRPVTRQLMQKMRVGEGDRHVALLHVDEIACRAKARRGFDRGDEVHQSDRLLGADIDDAPCGDRRQAVMLHRGYEPPRGGGRGLRQQARHGLDEILHEGEVAFHISVIINVDRAPLEQGRRKFEKRHVRPAPRPIDREETQHRDRNVIQMAIGMGHLLIGFFRGGVKG